MATAASAFPRSATGGQAPLQAIPNFGAGKTVRYCKYYFLQLDTLFTGNTGEVKTNQSQTVEFPVNVRGATTELNLFNQIQMQEPSRYNFSFTNMPFLSIAQQTGNVLQYNWWKRAYSLTTRQPILATMVNINGDPDGNLIFFGEKADTYGTMTVPANSKIYFLEISWKFSGTTGIITATNQAIDIDLMIFGASYSGGLSNNTVQITDMSANYQWSLNYLRMQYFFGMFGQINPILWYPTPYFLPRNQKIQIQASNVDALTQTVYLTFYCLTMS
jgi:hypothetical protein